MAVRGFDGVDDVITVAVGAIPAGDGPLTILCLWKPLAVEAGCLIRALDTVSGNTEYAINPYSDGNVYFSNGNFVSMAYTATDGWLITGFSKAAGNVAATGHKYVFDTATWTHPASGTLSGSAVVADLIRFGFFSGVEYGQMRLAAIAVWASKLADATIETLDTALADWLAAGPAALWPFTQASVADPVADATGGGANQTSIVGTTVVTTDDPPGFSLNLAAPITGTLTGTLPELTGTITTSSVARGTLAGSLPELTGQFRQAGTPMLTAGGTAASLAATGTTPSLATSGSAPVLTATGTP